MSKRKPRRAPNYELQARRIAQREVSSNPAPVEQPPITARDLGPDGLINKQLMELQRAERRARIARREAAQLVAELRSQGCSWTVIARQLGITRQAASARYSPRH